MKYEGNGSSKTINWDEIPQEDQQMHLTLFVFIMGNNLKLNRRSISVGGSSAAPY